MPHGPDLPLAFAGLPGTPEHHLSVDGMTARGPNLSHWPGNRTPVELKADLSTQICLRFARMPLRWRTDYLGDAAAVLNDHYDTDGFLSMLAVTRPEVALPREEVCVAAAATGDYQAFQTERGFAIDRIVRHLTDPDRSPIARSLHGLAAGARALACYRWLIDNAECVLDRPADFENLWRDELVRIEDELRRGRRGAVELRVHHRAQLSVITSRLPFERMSINTLAPSTRVLHVRHTGDGPLYRYHDRTESWFEVVTFAPPPRRDLRALQRLLTELEPATSSPFGWRADAPDTPVPELWHGLDEPQEYGEITRTLAPSRLPPDLVERTVVEFFSAPPAPADRQA